jgi:hypothetical protein
MVERQAMYETRFTMDTSSIKFGPGATREVGAGYGSPRRARSWSH